MGEKGEKGQKPEAKKTVETRELFDRFQKCNVYVCFTYLSIYTINVKYTDIVEKNLSVEKCNPKDVVTIEFFDIWHIHYNTTIPQMNVNLGLRYFTSIINYSIYSESTR